VRTELRGRRAEATHRGVLGGKRPGDGEPVRPGRRGRDAEPSDPRGMLNLLTPSLARDQLARADGGSIYDLAVDLFVGMPTWTAGGEPPYQIWMTHTPRVLSSTRPQQGRASSRSSSSVFLVGKTEVTVCITFSH
jgi:hypothetical protein